MQRFIFLLLFTLVLSCNYQDMPYQLDSVIMSQDLIPDSVLIDQSIYPDYPDAVFYGIDDNNVKWFTVSPVPDELQPPISFAKPYIETCTKYGWQTICQLIDFKFVWVKVYTCMVYELRYYAGSENYY